ncbi:unnamed protein product [Trichogramma brassicae]|uniref:Uncharacterized protein n=1 Tax=Trichogramma brassicae TaxID=86971 RepID=A0A6H5HWJ7_9HYME|nr:unnamed protein product [Trichogramma brassicae]
MGRYPDRDQDRQRLHPTAAQQQVSRLRGRGRRGLPLPEHLRSVARHAAGTAGCAVRHPRRRLSVRRGVRRRPVPHGRGGRDRRHGGLSLGLLRLSQHRGRARARQHGPQGSEPRPALGLREYRRLRRRPRQDHAVRQQRRLGERALSLPVALEPGPVSERRLVQRQQLRARQADGARPGEGQTAGRSAGLPERGARRDGRVPEVSAGSLDSPGHQTLYAVDVQSVHAFRSGRRVRGRSAVRKSSAGRDHRGRRCVRCSVDRGHSQRGGPLSGRRYAPIKAFQKTSIIFIASIFSILRAEYVNNDAYLKELDENWETIAPHLLDFNFTIPLGQHAEVARKIRRHYFGDRPIDRSSVDRLIKMVGDRLYVVDIEKAARDQAKKNRSPVLVYYYSYRALTSQSDYYSHSMKDYDPCIMCISLVNFSLYCVDEFTDAIENRPTRIRPDGEAGGAVNGCHLVLPHLCGRHFHVLRVQCTCEVDRHLREILLPDLVCTSCKVGFCNY